jgi:hypothetical protein
MAQALSSTIGDPGLAIQDWRSKIGDPEFIVDRQRPMTSMIVEGLPVFVESFQAFRRPSSVCWKLSRVLEGLGVVLQNWRSRIADRGLAIQDWRPRF